MNSVLSEILDAKKEHLEARKKAVPLSRLKDEATKALPRRDFRAAIARRDRINIIAEIKKASPSAGIIVKEFDPVKLAAAYTNGGAAAISVLTEEKFFKGSLPYLEQVRAASILPLLRKDFIFDPYQIYESQVAGADAVLLIAALLEVQLLQDLLDLSHSLGLDCLVEVHTKEELEKVLCTSAEIIGINNRDLGTFKVDLAPAKKICEFMPKNRITVIESGIKTAKDIQAFRECGVHSFLIGETLVRSGDICATLKEFREALSGV
jgi:indole-3-glycerol phosphate synthase